MRVIYKYQIPIKESFTINMPKNARIIRIDDVGGLCFMWAEVDTNSPNENRDFRAYKTGQEFKNEEKTIEVRDSILEVIKETLDSLSNKKIKKCIEIKYFSEDENTKSYTEVADKMNVTVQTIINWHNKFIKIVRQKCKNRKIIFDFQ